MSKPAIKLVLSGSGTKYPVFAGALKSIRRRYDVKAICGTSGGALVGAATASGRSADEVIKMVRENRPSDLLDFNWMPSLSATKGRFAGNRLLKRFREILPEDFNKCAIPFHCITWNLNRGIHVVHQQKGDLPRAVRASMSLPFVFDPVPIAGELHVDGGIGANFPLDIYGAEQATLGLRFRPQNPQKFRKVESKLEMAETLIDGLIESCTREHVEDAMWAKTMLLDTTNSGMDFGMSLAEIDVMVAEGEHCAEEWFRLRRE
jgi:predicted acylesterase/phospholipase RssA